MHMTGARAAPGPAAASAAPAPHYCPTAPPNDTRQYSTHRDPTDTLRTQTPDNLHTNPRDLVLSREAAHESMRSMSNQPLRAEQRPGEP